MTYLINVRFNVEVAVIEKSDFSSSLATFKRLEEHGIVLITPREEFKFTSITLMCTYFSNYSYLSMLLYVYFKVGPRGRSRSHASVHGPLALLPK